MDYTPQADVVLPAHLPAQCFVQPAQDFRVPEMVLVALVKVESGDGHSKITKNANGTYDLGVAQTNTASWVPYLKKHYGIDPSALAYNACQSIRAAAFVLRMEMNHKTCNSSATSQGENIWCGVRRYHAPNNKTAAEIYVSKVYKAMMEIAQKGKF
jgi:Transglycosylase SLT domain